jgi:hypothetical protein
VRTTRHAKGSTLVELLVASSVISVALMATAAAVIESSKLETDNAATRAVGPIVAALLDEARMTPFAQVQATWNGTTRQIPGIPGCPTQATATWTVSDVAGSSTKWIVRRVNVELQWPGPHGTQRVSAVTYVSDRTVGMEPPMTSVPVDPL